MLVVTDEQYKRAWEILRLVVAEWRSDPMSVQCFDLRIVREATELVDRDNYTSMRRIKHAEQENIRD